MKKCPYCGTPNMDKSIVCEKCKAMFPADKPKEQPVKTDKKKDKE